MTPPAHHAYNPCEARTSSPRSRWLLLLLFLLIPFHCFADDMPHVPQRIISIAPSFTEILFALGAGPRVVGTTNYCDYPPEAQKTAKIGDLLNPNIERIVALHPDIVFLGAWKWQVPEKLRSLGINVVEVKDAENVNDILNRIRLIGSKVGKANEANELIARMQEQLNTLRKNSAALPVRHKVYVELDTGNWTAGGGSYMNEIFEIAGFQNIFGDRKEPYLMITTESIAARDPDVIVSLARTVKEFKDAAEWSSCRAIQQGAIVDKNAIDWNAITRQSPRLPEGIRDLIAATHRALKK